MLRRSGLVVAVLVAMFCGIVEQASGATIDVGTRIAITPTTFALPVEVAGATGLIGWEFSLLYDPADVQIDTTCDSVSDAFCGLLTGPVTEGAFFAAGAPFNLLNPGFVELDPSTFQQTGTLLAAQGAYGGPPPGPSGDGVIAYVRFLRLGNGDTPIQVVDVSVTEVPEPQSLLLLMTALSLLARKRIRRR